MAETPSESISADKVVVWYSSSEQSISATMADFLNDNGVTPSVRTLYFIDAMGRFPIKEFCQLLPPQENGALFENVRVMASLDLGELIDVVGKIAQFTQVARSAHSRDPVKSPSPQVLVFLRGLDVMFRNTALRDQSRAHLLLRDIMLRLRMIAKSSTSTTKTIVLFPAFHNTNESSADASQPPSKKHKMNPSSLNNNSLAAYISKYYADRIVVLGKP
ncbi:LANO_0H07910g1_1 [Lachancea nothofagi CBS 11611]|uniref:LANO_0H07910g1_1 n=1 Tax=Lachancea nothofagi CBS 11611 TaxID=1266666 RepID=A0A1G4KLU3_9SACH|nr:LANO_0H07910g1_1 [Lachancea nothofagi CBS 11611]